MTYIRTYFIFVSYTRVFNVGPIPVRYVDIGRRFVRERWHAVVFVVVLPLLHCIFSMVTALRDCEQLSRVFFRMLYCILGRSK